MSSGLGKPNRFSVKIPRSLSPKIGGGGGGTEVGGHLSITTDSAPFSSVLDWIRDNQVIMYLTRKMNPFRQTSIIFYCAGSNIKFVMWEQEQMTNSQTKNI